MNSRLRAALLASLALTPVVAQSTGLGQSLEEPEFRGSRLLPADLRLLDRPIARVLLLETWELALSRAQAAVDVAAAPQHLARLRDLGRDKRQLLSLARRDLAVGRATLARRGDPGPADSMAREAWGALADHLLGQASTAEARRAFARLAQRDLAAEGAGSDADPWSLAAVLWPLAFLKSRAVEPATAARGRDILTSNALFPAARRGDLILSFPAAYLAAVGLAWVEEQRYEDAIFYLLDENRLPVVMPEAVGLAGLLRPLSLERHLANAARRTSDSGQDASEGSELAEVVPGTVREALLACLSPAAPAVTSSTDPEAAATPVTEAPAPSAAVSRQPRRRSGGGFFLGLAAGVAALLLAVAWRKVRGRRVWLARSRAPTRTRKHMRGHGGGPPTLLTAMAVGLASLTGLALADDDSPAVVWSARAPRLREVPSGLAGPVVLDGSPIAISDLGSPPPPLGRPRLLLPPGRHRLRLGDAVKPQLIDAGSFLPVYARLRNAAASTAGLARLLRDRGEQPHDPLAPHLLGNYLAGLGAQAQARDCWFRALVANPAFVPAIANLAISLGRDGARPRARSLAAVALAIDPGDAYGVGARLRLELRTLGMGIAPDASGARLADLLAARDDTHLPPAALDRAARGVVRFYAGIAKFLPDVRERAKADSNAGLYLQTRGRHRQAASLFRTGVARLRRASVNSGGLRSSELGILETRTSPASDPVAATIYENLIRSLEVISPAEARVYRLVAALERGE